MALASLAPDADGEEVGQALLDLLEQSGSLVANQGGEEDALHAAVGVPSRRELVKAARYAAVRREGDTITVSTPSR